MASGTEMMINAAIKAMGIDPKQFLAQVADIMKVVQTFDARLSAMECDLRDIKNHLGISDGDKHSADQESRALEHSL